ncbi:hypothetical protein EYF80_037060 [Liparis tanakae]|uniref:Uncharacterized protein n=1 Tax=Liparis tanakae TaxID=230148 RepID=A0A4Z2GGZ4_9TELE|nr:hypothetical protein EYF80_037060 [Liparis tanakae]
MLHAAPRRSTPLHAAPRPSPGDVPVTGRAGDVRRSGILMAVCFGNLGRRDEMCRSPEGPEISPSSCSLTDGLNRFLTGLTSNPIPSSPLHAVYTGVRNTVVPMKGPGVRR